ncbi:MAG TPA: class I SAM-dependent methyltransferase [Myxococcota bacterium]|nr:class I SAM-dependent methyltransferase [Myxococcota bacterium]
MEAARNLVELRIRELSGARLRDFLTREGPLAVLSPAVERAAREGRSALERELRDDRTRARLAAFLARKTREWVLRENPFLEIEPAHERVIEAVHAALLRDVGAALARGGEWEPIADALRAALASHEARLGALVAALLREAGEAPDDRERVAAEYSPELQLRVLGVRAEDLRAPVLDLGCGAKGALVHHLRAAGLAPVIGVDRNAPAGPGFFRESWFSADLARHAWGAVIAHQSFSLHFLHAHVHSEVRAARFAQRYLEILHALAPHGRFLYAPALPFLEAVLPAEWVVTTRPIAGTDLLAASVAKRAA